jgi:CheY-like chemotaxis protein
MPKILLVEDDQAQCELLEEVFTEEGFRVGVASTGQQALDTLDQEGEWVVLLDLVLPGMSGREVLRALRDTPRLLDKNKVILMSASWKTSGIEAQRESPRSGRLGPPQTL